MQDLIVILIGIVVFSYVGWTIYKAITKKPSASDKCAGCSGCALKEKVDCAKPDVKV